MRPRFAPAAAALALVLPAAPARAAACRLDAADCAVIAREQVATDAADEHDAATFAPGLSGATRGRDLILRQSARRRERYVRLPPRIADEWARMGLCDAVEAANAEAPGSAPVPAKCR